MVSGLSQEIDSLQYDNIGRIWYYSNLCYQSRFKSQGNRITEFLTVSEKVPAWS